MMGTARVAFIGLGRMGLGMAGRLLDAGHEVVVYNRTAGKAAPLTARGARSAESPRAASDGADAVFSMVADDAASRAMWLGDEGALAGLAGNALVIECSTLSYDWVEELAGAADMVDPTLDARIELGEAGLAGVIGGQPRAQAPMGGRLWIATSLRSSR